MQTNATSCLPSSGGAHSAEPRPSTSVSRLNQVQAETHTSTDLALMTAEGDRVTLSTDSLTQADYTSYDARGRLRGQRLEVHAEALQFTSTQTSTLVVEGDLNAAELADIQQVLDTLGELASNFFAGKLDTPPGQAFDLEELDTLRSVTANLAYSQNVTVSQVTQARVAGNHPPRLDENTPALQTPSRTPGNPQHLLKKILHALDAAQADPARVAAKMPKLLDKLAEKLGRWPDFDTHKPQVFPHVAPPALGRFSPGSTAGVPEAGQSRQDG